MSSKNMSPCPGTVKWEWITPEMAQKLLDNPLPGQRNRKPGLIKKLTRAMREGAMTGNGESIVVSDKGRVLDGCNRLAAVVFAKFSGWFVVVRGVKEFVYWSFDGGEKRSAADALKKEGYNDPHVLAQSAILMSIIIKNDILSRHLQHTPLDVNKIAKKHVGLSDGIKVSNNPGLRRILRRSTIVALLYLFCLTERRKVKQFFYILETGLAKDRSNPAVVLRERLLDLKTAMKVAGAADRTSRTWEVAVVIKAWQAYVHGEKIAKNMLDYKKGEKFPVIPKLKYEL